MPRPIRDPKAKRKLPPAIEPTAAYSRANVLALLPSVGYDAIREEIRAGRLRETVRLGHRLILGQWLLDWLAAGEVASAGSESSNHSGIA